MMYDELVNKRRYIIRRILELRKMKTDSLTILRKIVVELKSPINTSDMATLKQRLDNYFSLTLTSEKKALYLHNIASQILEAMRTSAMMREPISLAKPTSSAQPNPIHIPIHAHAPAPKPTFAPRTVAARPMDARGLQSRLNKDSQRLRKVVYGKRR